MNCDSLSPNSQRSPRVEVRPLAFVDGPVESTFLLNLSEGGMAVQAMEVLPQGFACPFSFALPGSDVRISGIAHVAWSDCSGRAGMKFVALATAEQMQLAEWVRQAVSTVAAEAPVLSQYDIRANNAARVRLLTREA